MISGISSGDDPTARLLSNMLKNIIDTESNLMDKLMKVSVTEQVEAASEAGVGSIVDEYA